MTDPKKTGLPADIGDQMSDRAGDCDESESGETETPTRGGVPIPDGEDMPEDVLDRDGSGTTFDAGDDIPR